MVRPQKSILLFFIFFVKSHAFYSGSCDSDHIDRLTESPTAKVCSPAPLPAGEQQAAGGPVPRTVHYRTRHRRPEVERIRVRV